ncbi:hypothetical protein DFH28DRAFT_1122216 [Melampsora americana]|nr:hypothetical protein DFH28DRAFT_1122216 [Melampsora americana]
MISTPVTLDVIATHGLATVQTNRPALSNTASTDASKSTVKPLEFNHAITYVNKIKNCYSSNPKTYPTFLDILQTYQRDARPIQEHLNHPGKFTEEDLPNYEDEDEDEENDFIDSNVNDRNDFQDSDSDDLVDFQVSDYVNDLKLNDDEIHEAMTCNEECIRAQYNTEEEFERLNHYQDPHLIQQYKDQLMVFVRPYITDLYDPRGDGRSSAHTSETEWVL